MNIEIGVVPDNAADMRSLALGTRLRRVDGLTTVDAALGFGKQSIGWELPTVTFGAGGVGMRQSCRTR